MSSKKIQNSQNEPLFYTLAGEKDAIQAFNLNSDAYDDQTSFSSSNASSSRTFINYDSNYSVKSDYKRDDYEKFRESERIPTKSKDIMSVCNRAYKRVGIVRNVIDLMGDFGVKGIKIQHSNPAYQKLFNTWFKKVSGKERSERFLNILYRLGNVVVQRYNGKITTKDINAMRKAKSALNEEVDIELINDKIYKNKIVPLKYIFLNPVNLEEKNTQLGTFTGVKSIYIKLNPQLVNEIKTVIKDSIKSNNDSYLKTIPRYIIDGIQRNEQKIEIPREQLSFFYYKKDDWDSWADPITYSILDNLITLEKMNLADMSALDGAISNIRLWTLGIFDGPQNSIMPTKTAINKLRNILANNVGGGTIDLVWGPELSFKESDTKVHQFLGSEKYEVTFDLIYDGLGIPASLRSGGSNASSSNGHIALKTLIERLEYGRTVLVSFWEQEINILCKALGITDKPVISFETTILSDEAAEKQLLLHLVDRDIVSNESILEKFNFVPYIEKARIKTESRKRGKSSPLKASPYHNPEVNNEFKKIILQTGGVAPSEIGVDLLPKKEGEKSRHDLNIESLKQKVVTDKFDPPNQAGRPKSVTETSKRKEKPSGKPNLKAGSAQFIDLFMWSNIAQKNISDLVTPAVLHTYRKKNVRSLSKEETNHLENLKEDILFSISPYSQINDENAYNIVQSTKANSDMKMAFKTLCNRFSLNYNRQATIEEMKEIRSSVFALTHEEVE